jgi:hypothetical protein
MRPLLFDDRDGLSGGLSGEPCCERHAGFALIENEHGPCALADDEIALPMAGLDSGVDILGPFADGDAILDHLGHLGARYHPGSYAGGDGIGEADRNVLSRVHARVAQTCVWPFRP